MEWARVAGAALLAAAAVYVYAATALAVHANLARVPAPRGLAVAVLLGLAVPACGCTAFPLARRARGRARAAFLVAAYAGNPLLVLAAGLLAGAPAALAVVALAVLAALVAAAAPPVPEPLSRQRLDDLLLRRETRPWRDALPYAGRYGAPTVALGALVAVAPAWSAGLLVGGLAALFAARPRDLAAEWGALAARRITVVHAGFAVVASVGVVVVGWV